MTLEEWQRSQASARFLQPHQRACGGNGRGTARSCAGSCRDRISHSSSRRVARSL